MLLQQLCPMDRQCRQRGQLWTVRLQKPGSPVCSEWSSHHAMVAWSSGFSVVRECAIIVRWSGELGKPMGGWYQLTLWQPKGKWTFNNLICWVMGGKLHNTQRWLLAGKAPLMGSIFCSWKPHCPFILGFAFRKTNNLVILPSQENEYQMIANTGLRELTESAFFIP